MRLTRVLPTLLLSLIGLLVITGWWLPSVAQAAVQCGMNIDPANPAGYPTAASLKTPGDNPTAGLQWVRIEYKDCTKADPPTESMAMFGDVLKEYHDAGIKTLVILDYMSYPQAQDNLEGFAKRAQQIDATIGQYINAYEIWNEPDASGNSISLDAATFAKVVNGLAPTLMATGKPVYIGGFAQGLKGSTAPFLTDAIKADMTSNYTGVSIHIYANPPSNFANIINGYRRSVPDGSKYAGHQGKPIWITETGLPDKNSSKVADFIKGSFNAVGNAAGPIPMIWYAWSDGMNDGFGLVNTSAQPKNPAYDTYFKETCGGSSPGTVAYKPAIVPPSETGVGCGGGTTSSSGTDDSAAAAKDPYYLYPIAGTLGPEPNADAIKEDLIAQGYQAWCTVPKFGITAIDTIDSDLKKRLLASGAINPAQPINLKGEQKFDFSNSQIPIWRNAGAVTVDELSSMASLEGFWSHKNQTGLTQLQQDLQSAPIYRLISLKQQCEQQVNMLEVIDKKCDKLPDPSKCALNAPIRGTQFTASSLLQEWRAYTSTGGNCEAVSLKKNGQFDQARFTALATGLNNTPLYLPNAYRLAFLVVFGELKKSTNPLGPFNFLRPNGTDSPKHEVRVIAFKIPDAATNKDDQPLAPGDPYDDSSYHDAIQLTRDTLLTTEQQQANFDKAKVLKNRLKSEAALGYENSNFGESVIACGSDCLSDDKPAVAALVKFVNERLEDTLTCEANPQDLKTEPSQAIFSDGGLAYKEDETPLESALKKRQVADQVQPEFNFLGQVFINDVGGEKGGKVKSVLVYPQGYELETVEKTLAGLLYDAGYVAGLHTEHDIANYFKIGEVDNSFNGEKRKIGSFLNQACVARQNLANLTRPANEKKSAQAIAQECTEEPEVELKHESEDMDDRTPRIKGGVLGFVTRKIQQALQPITSPVYLALEKCTSTEDFLLGRCGGKASTQASQDIDALLTCKREDFATDEEYQTCLTSASSDACMYKALKTTVPASLEDMNHTLCQAGFEYDVPAFMLRNILAIEGGRAFRNALEPGGFGTQLSCEVSDSGDVGPFQIHINQCVKGYSGDETSGNQGYCSFETGALAAARTLHTKENFVRDINGFSGNWATQTGVNLYRYMYYMGGYYNGTPECVKIPGTGCAINKPGELCQRVEGLTYCGYALTRFSGEFTCPVTSNDSEEYKAYVTKVNAKAKEIVRMTANPPAGFGR